jgi:hypothetical protein
MNQTVVYRAWYSSDGVGKTGLSVSATIYGPDRSKVVDAQPAIEVGSGFYEYPYSTTSSKGEYSCLFITDDTTVDQRHIPAQWSIGRGGVDNLDSKVSDTLQANDYTPPTAVDLSGLATSQNVVDVADDIKASFPVVPTATDNANAVLDDAATAHNTAGSVGEKINNAGSVAGIGETHKVFVSRDSSGAPIAGVEVRAYDDEARTIQRGFMQISNSSGETYWNGTSGNPVYVVQLHSNYTFEVESETF